MGNKIVVFSVDIEFENADLLQKIVEELIIDGHTEITEDLIFSKCKLNIKTETTEQNGEHIITVIIDVNRHILC